MTNRTFDAISLSSLMRREVKAKAAATAKEATAKAFSMGLLILIQARK